jgi:hypothetical protein
MNLQFDKSNFEFAIHVGDVLNQTAPKKYIAEIYKLVESKTATPNQLSVTTDSIMIGSIALPLTKLIARLLEYPEVDGSFGIQQFYTSIVDFVLCSKTNWSQDQLSTSKYLNTVNWDENGKFVKECLEFNHFINFFKDGRPIDSPMYTSAHAPPFQTACEMMRTESRSSNIPESTHSSLFMSLIEATNATNDQAFFESTVVDCFTQLLDVTVNTPVRCIDVTANLQLHIAAAVISHIMPVITLWKSLCSKILDFSEENQPMTSAIKLKFSATVLPRFVKILLTKFDSIQEHRLTWWNANISSRVSSASIYFAIDALRDGRHVEMPHESFELIQALRPFCKRQSARLGYNIPQVFTKAVVSKDSLPQDVCWSCAVFKSNTCICLKQLLHQASDRDSAFTNAALAKKIRDLHTQTAHANGKVVLFKKCFHLFTKRPCIVALSGFSCKCSFKQNKRVRDEEITLVMEGREILPSKTCSCFLRQKIMFGQELLLRFKNPTTPKKEVLYYIRRMCVNGKITS